MSVIRREAAERYRRNRDFLNARFGRSTPLVIPPGDALRQLGVLDAQGNLTNVRLAGSTLYPASARESSDSQLAATLEGDGRYRPSMTRATDEDDLLFPLMAKIDDLAGAPFVADPKPYSFDAKHAPVVVLFGLGLGLQVRSLLERCDVRHLIVYEPNAAFVDLSCYLIDWKKTISQLSERGRSFHLLCDQNGEMVGQAIVKILQQNVSSAMLTGAVVLKHYEAANTNAAADELRRCLPLLTQVHGYFKDQARQIAHSVGSIKTADLYLKQRLPPRPGGLIVIGAGPSLDTTMALASALKGRATIFTGGSALRPVLRAGIVPDLHIELESDPSVGNVLDSIGAPDILKRMLLVTTTAGAPATNARFETTAIFKREGSAGGSLLDPAILGLPYADPLVGNAAVALGYALGFRTIAMFGVDFGFRDKARHHAAGTVYIDDKTGLAQQDFKSIGVNMAIPGFESDIAYYDLPSTLGDRITANEIFLTSLRIQEALLTASPGLRLIQCGNGARVPGAVNVAPGDFNLEEFAAGGAVRREELLAAFAPLSEAMRDLQGAIDRLKAAARTQLKPLLSIMDPPPANLPALLSCAQAAFDLVETTRRTVSATLAILISGPLQGFFQIIVGRSAGITDAGEQRRFLEAAAAGYREAVKRMSETIAAS